MRVFDRFVGPLINMRRFLLAAIRAYQRYLSPYKGFSCAYREHTGHASCSTLGFRAVRKHGIFRGLTILRERTYRCGVAQRRYTPVRGRPFASQRGECDIGCDLPCDLGCDLPGGKSISRMFDFFNCCDCGSCDWPTRKRKGYNEAEQYVYIPPKARGRKQPQYTQP